MLTSSTTFTTPNGSKYLVQLCKHFAHKIDVEYDETNGRAALPSGAAELLADTDGLNISITSEDEKQLGMAQHVIEDHLKRFAFREEFDALNWS
ncbi:DUF2218 domain-containing protein [Rhodobacteraceae bacterium D3-12]|nr:DUF2218 domain-containing protein [Rhodobacteraceae bacterium D3-12]